MAALFLADVAPQTGCILPLWIVLCVFVESPIGAISSPVVVVPFLVAASSSSTSPSFASSATFRSSTLSSLSFPPLFTLPPSTLPPLFAIDRQKSHGGIVKARREGTARLAPWIYPPQTRTFFRELPTKRRVFKVLGSNTANVC